MMRLRTWCFIIILLTGRWWIPIEVQLDPLKTAVADLKDYVQEQRDDARRAKDDGDMMSYKIGMATASAIEKQAVKGLETGLRTAQGATKTTKDQIRRSMTSAIEGLVITYHQTLASKELVDTSVALAQAAYDSVDYPAGHRYGYRGRCAECAEVINQRSRMDRNP